MDIQKSISHFPSIHLSDDDYEEATDWYHNYTSHTQTSGKKVFINDEQENAKSKFASNNVITSKYTLWNFLPKFLFENLNPRYKFANFYFVIAGILQVCPPSFHGRLAAMIDDSFHHYYESLSICIDFCRIRAIDGGLYSDHSGHQATQIRW